MSITRPAGMMRPGTGAALMLGVVGLLAGCGEKDKTSTQAAARVNKDEITVHQIGALLAQQPVKPEMVAQTERQLLERLINRELAVQKAVDLKVDRDPRVVQAIESARRDIMARAYADKLSEGAARPSPAEIKKYYDDHPVLFRERKIFQIQEFILEADAKQIGALKTAMPPMKTTDDLAQYLKANGLKFATNQAVRAAEQLPLSALPILARLRDGESLFNPTPSGAQIIFVKGSRAQPVDEERASRAIEQFLLNEQKRKLLADDLKALRAAAKIEYQGRFAASAPVAAEAVRAPTPSEVAASAAATLDIKSVNEALRPSAEVPGSAASAIDMSTVNKGLGLK